MGAYAQRVAAAHDRALPRVRSDSDVEQRTAACMHKSGRAVRRRVITCADGEAVTDIGYPDPDPLACCPGAGRVHRGNA